jgi:hypothetical protein
MCLMTPDPGLYSFLNQGVLTVDGINDTEEMKNTDVSICYIYLLLIPLYIYYYLACQSMTIKKFNVIRVDFFSDDRINKNTKLL